MARPLEQVYYTLNSAKSGSSHYNTSLTAPVTSFASNASGWIVGNTAAPRFNLMDFQTEKASATLQTTVQTTNEPNTGSGTGDCFVIGPIRGKFLSGIWQITQSLKANTNGGAADGGLVYRVYTGSLVSGAGARPFVATFFSSSLYANLATATPGQTVRTTVNLAEINFNREPGYVFFQNQLRTTGAGGNANADVNYYFGPTTQSVVKTTQLLTHPASSQLIQDDMEFTFN